MVIAKWAFTMIPIFLYVWQDLNLDSQNNALAVQKIILYIFNYKGSSLRAQHGRGRKH